METSTFKTSKTIKKCIQFDKDHKLWRLFGEQKEYPYEELEKAETIEQRKQKTGITVLTNILEFSAIGSASQGNEIVKVVVRITLKDQSEIFCDVTKDFMQKGTLQYHDDVRVAKEITKALRTIMKRQEEV